MLGTLPLKGRDPLADATEPPASMTGIPSKLWQRLIIRNIPRDITDFVLS
jgi:hypothetical protein